MVFCLVFDDHNLPMGITGEECPSVATQSTPYTSYKCKSHNTDKYCVCVQGNCSLHSRCKIGKRGGKVGMLGGAPSSPTPCLCLHCMLG